MPEQSPRITSPYNAVDYYWPIQWEYGESGQPTKLLIKDTWYPFAESLYRGINRLTRISRLEELSAELLDKIDYPDIPQFVIGPDGPGSYLSVIGLVLAAVLVAVDAGLDISRFKLHRGWGPSGIGWSPMGPIFYREF